MHFIGSRHTRSITLALGEAVASSAAADEDECIAPGAKHSGVVIDLGGKPESCMGFYLEQIYDTSSAPFAVSIDSEGIIGPSAGLAFTLGLLEKLDPADLTGGKRIAATGTIAISSTVPTTARIGQAISALEHIGGHLVTQSAK